MPSLGVILRFSNMVFLGKVFGNLEAPRNRHQIQPFTVLSQLVELVSVFRQIAIAGLPVKLAHARAKPAPPEAGK